MKKKNIGSTFDSFLRVEGIYEEVSAAAIKRVVARQVEDAMQQKGFPKPRRPAACTLAERRSTGCLTLTMTPLP
jgi:hypothetical protein